MKARRSVAAPIVDHLEVESVAPGSIERRRVVLTENAAGSETLVPVIIARATAEGPVVGITAALHGNELNGIRVIHRLLRVLNDSPLLKGTVVAVPITNVPGYLRAQREFEDGVDLNRIMPGDPRGGESDLYAYRLVDRIVSRFDYLIDLHTASFGRVNSLYIRADMSEEEPARLARLIEPQIIVHNPGGDGTLRAAAAARGIHAITVEVGNPQRLQPGLVRSTRLGIQEALESLGMLSHVSDPDGNDVIECTRSYWIRTDRGGVLTVPPDVEQMVKRGDVIAYLHDVWGDLVCEFTAPEDGIVVGKATNPAARAGSRILHLGILGSP